MFDTGEFRYLRFEGGDFGAENKFTMGIYVDDRFIEGGFEICVLTGKIEQRNGHGNSPDSPEIYSSIQP